jgi:hypothetical protein
MLKLAPTEPPVQAASPLQFQAYQSVFDKSCIGDTASTPKT